jgi:glutamate-5-semialdehyde dehydrogenase
MESKAQVIKLCQDAKRASKLLATCHGAQKNKALFSMAEYILQHQAQIISANVQDMSLAKQKGLSGALLDRLLLDGKRVKSMAEGLKAIAALPDPVGKVLSHWQQPSGLDISKVSVPIGVIAVIYESRPNVTADAAGLCLKSGNAVILRGGSESAHSSRAILECLQLGLTQTKLPIHAIQMLPSQSREMVTALIQQDQYVDVIVPRGGKKLIKALTEKSRIPLFKHLEGLCHTYIHADASVEKAANIALNAKMRRTGICGATETLLIDQKIIKSHLPIIMKALLDAGCELRLDKILKESHPSLPTAVINDWSTEYLDGIISIKVVENINEALAHINQYSSQHTDAIVTENDEVATRFLTEVDSAIVMHNTSTQFADGGEFGMGAEIGISTGKLHARGPVGVEQLTTFKYLVRSKGMVRPT